MSLQIFLRAVSLATLALALSRVAPAQPASQPIAEWSVITVTQIKPEFRQEYEAFQKEVTAAYKKQGAPFRVVVQTMFGDINEYLSVAPLAKYADLDGPSMLVKAMGEAKSQQLLRRAGGYVLSMHRYTSLAMPDVSIRTSLPDQGEYAQVTTYRLMPGKATAFSDYIKNDYLPAMRKADVANFWVSRPIFGADLNERTTVRLMHKLAELDGGPLLTKTLGAEEAGKVNAKANGIIESTHFTVVHVRTDLSLMPGPPAAKPKTSE